MFTPDKLDALLEPVPQPSANYKLPPHGDITRLPMQELLQFYWSETEKVAYAKDRLSLLGVQKMGAKESLRDFEAAFRFQHNNLPKIQQEAALAADYSWQELHREVVRLEAMVLALDGRIEAFVARTKTVSRELSRRGIDAALSQKGV